MTIDTRSAPEAQRLARLEHAGRALLTAARALARRAAQQPAHELAELQSSAQAFEALLTPAARACSHSRGRVDPGLPEGSWSCRHCGAVFGQAAAPVATVRCIWLDANAR